MSYLAKLKAEISENVPPSVPTELTEGPSVGSVSTDRKHFSKDAVRKGNTPVNLERIQDFQKRSVQALTELTEEWRPSDPSPAQQRGKDCSSCAHLLMNCERHEGTRRIWFWRCTKDHQILEMGYAGQRVLVAPETCDTFERWTPATAKVHP